MNTLEVCCGSLESAIAALQGGAQRIELCSALSEGGITPSAGLMHAVGSLDSSLVKHVLIRPRGGDFLYTNEEAEIMAHDIRTARQTGMHGVVIGALRPDGTLDIPLLQRLIDVANGLSLTLHRAFDLCSNPEEALEQAISLGFHRILTSGQAPTAEAGIPRLAALQHQAAGRIRIMPGCGVNATNAARILQATHCTDIHASARTIRPSAMTFRHEGVAMGKEGTDEYARQETSREEVRRIVDAIRGIC